MATKKAAKAPGRDPDPALLRPASPAAIRNVAVVGHSGAGKTTLVEALLVEAGAIPRAGTVADGTTVSDCDPLEVAHHHSVCLSLCPLGWNDTVINLIDTPGSPDFLGEVRAGLRAADAAVFVVSAAAPIDPVTVSLWDECDLAGTPRCIVVERHDAPRAALVQMMDEAARVFGTGGADVRPLYLPAGATSDAGSPQALFGVLTGIVYDRSSGAPRQLPLTTDVVIDGSPDQARASLIEAIIDHSEDETLLDRYLAGETIDPDVLVADLERAVWRGRFHPVIPVDSVSGLGLGELLDGIVRGFPSPVERTVPPTTTIDGAPAEQLVCNPGGPLLAEVVHTTVDPYLGRLSVLRVFSGTLTADTAIHVSGHTARGEHDADERVGSLLSPLGAALRPVDRVIAGDLCAIGRSASAETGDTVSAKAEPLVVTPWPMPAPLLPTAVRAVSRSDEDALARGLARLAAADPTVRVERSSVTGQLVLWCTGEAHAEVVLERLRSGGCALSIEDVQVPLMTTFAGEARGHGRLVKQSGGHGQYGVCDVVVTPLPRGSGVVFADKVVGGAVPSQFVGSVEKGVRAQLAEGLDERHLPVIDVQVALVDGRAHSVDSSDASFQTAGALAVKEAAATAGLCLLEPLARIEVTVPDAHVGAVLSDLSGRRARVHGTTSDPSARPGLERTIVAAEVPEAELVRYPLTLRAITQGTGSFTREFSRYDVLK
jgi:elongation factor G